MKQLKVVKIKQKIKLKEQENLLKNMQQELLTLQKKKEKNREVQKDNQQMLNTNKFFQAHQVKILMMLLELEMNLELKTQKKFLEHKKIFKTN